MLHLWIFEWLPTSAETKISFATPIVQPNEDRMTFQKIGTQQINVFEVADGVGEAGCALMSADLHGY